MSDVRDSLLSALDSFLHISLESPRGQNLEEFATTWQSTIDQHSISLSEDETADLAYNVANAIDIVCETLMGLSVFEDTEAERLDEQHDVVKAQLITRHTPPRSDKTELPTPSSSRESSPSAFSFSRQLTPTRQLSLEPASPIHASVILAEDSRNVTPPATPSDSTSPSRFVQPSNAVSRRKQDVASWLPPPATTEDYNLEGLVSSRLDASAGASFPILWRRFVDFFPL